MHSNELHQVQINLILKLLPRLLLRLQVSHNAHPLLLHEYRRAVVVERVLLADHGDLRVVRAPQLALCQDVLDGEEVRRVGLF